MKTKGFKATNPDMTCRFYQFELGKTFKHEGKIEPCRSGFHFCENIESIERYYNIDCRIFEVLSGENTIEDFDKTVTDEITFLKEIDYLQYVDHESTWVRTVVAHKGIGLDKLVNDEFLRIRQIVAKHGYGLDKLVNDPIYQVRLEVAKQGYGLDVLLSDYSLHVRLEVAKQGYGLDKLINDPSPSVRLEVAKQGYGLDKLINDDIWLVRDCAKNFIKK